MIRAHLTYPFSTLAAAALATVFVSCRDDASRTPKREPTRPSLVARSHASVFFVGHSLVNFEMPKNMEVMARSLGLELEWDAQIIDGAPLELHVEHPERTQSMRVDEALASGAYDTFVMAEAVPIDDMIRYRQSARHAATLARLARAHRPDARVFLDEVWMARDRPRGLPFLKRLDWRAFLDDDLPKWEKVADDAARLAGVPVAVLPAGRALGRLVDAIEAGEIPGLESEHDLFVDQVHLTPLGNHFIAAVTLTAIFRRSPKGASGAVVDGHGRTLLTLPEKTREALYRVAHEAIRTYPRAVAPEPRETALVERSAEVRP